MIICLALSLIVVSKPDTAEAAIDAYDGTIYVYHLDNDYKNGKYRFNEKIKYDYWGSNSIYPGVTIYDQYVTNSAGKKVASWGRWTICQGGGTKTFSYAVDFSKLPSDTYTLHFTVGADRNGYAVKYTRKVTHSAGKISYSSAKYEYDTNGNSILCVKFRFVSLKNYTPKLEVFDSSGNRVIALTNKGKIIYDDSIYSFRIYVSSLNKGTYTFKATCNGKSCSKKLTL